MNVIASCKPWGLIDRKDCVYVSFKRQLNAVFLDAINPRCIFFTHWSHLVPKEIVEKYECVCFHMTDVPFGRGGSPLQNLIKLGFQTTQLTALRMNEGLDTGPVYLKRGLSLEGTAEEIYRRAMRLASEMINEILTKNISPKPQIGQPFVFQRLKPEDSRISNCNVYDHIRMLDAEGYPKAFIEADGRRIEFSKARREGNKVVAEAVIG